MHFCPILICSAFLPEIATTLLRHLADTREGVRNKDAAGLAARMGEAGWCWAPSVLAALGDPKAAPAANAYKVWRRLPEWEEAAPPPPATAFPVEPAEARRGLWRKQDD